MARRKFTTDIISVSGSNVLNTLLQIPVGILLARVLGPEGNGIYNYILVVPGIISMISRLGMKRSTIYYIGKKTFSQEELISALTYIFIFTSSLSIIITGGIYFFMNREDMNFSMALIAICSIPVNIIINYASGIFIGSDQIKKYNVFQWIPTFSNLLLLIIFLLILKWSIIGALLAYLFANMLMAIYALKLLKKEYNFNLQMKIKIILEMVKMGFSFTLAGILMKLHYRIDVILLERLTDMEEVGYYTLATRFAEKWNGPLTVSAVISSRVAISEDFNLLKYNILRWIKVTFVLSLFACIVLYFLIPYLLPIMYGENFIPSIVMVQAILPGILMMVVYKALMSYFTGSGRPYILVISCSISLIINIILNLILIPKNGGIGAAWATNISYAILAIIMLIFFGISTKIPFKDFITYSQNDFKVVKKILKNIFR